MANMGYIRFENTLADLQDCEEHFDDELEGSEKRYRKYMLELCKQIVDNFGHELED